MFVRNISASLRACASYAAASLHVPRASSTWLGTPATSVGTASPKIGSVVVGALASEPSSAARTMARV